MTAVFEFRKGSVEEVRRVQYADKTELLEHVKRALKWEYEGPHRSASVHAYPNYGHTNWTACQMLNVLMT